MSEVYESDNRRAEISGNVVSFCRVTSHVRRSIEGVWFMTCEDTRKARRLAKAWAFRGRLGKAVLH